MLELPDAPDIIVLTDQQDSCERAKWLSMGCVAVLLQTLSATDLSSVIKAVPKRRKHLEPASIDRIRTLSSGSLRQLEQACAS